MVWIIALACLGLLGVIGSYQGPVRSLFSFFGLLFGIVLAGPLSPLTRPIVSLIGLKGQIWGLFMPQVLAFIVIVVIFMIAGNVVHHKVVVHVKYESDDARYFIWHRMFTRLGFCTGLFNGAVYFVLLMIPLYVGGWFALAAGAATPEGASLPGGARFLAHTRASLHNLGMDRLLAAYDPVPAKVYQAADITALILHNPLLESRLANYPPCLTLLQRHPEFHDLGNDLQLQQMIQAQAPLGEILKYPGVQAIVTNSAITGDIETLLGDNLDDLQTYLNTGQSPKYDSEPILGSWTINPEATYAQLRKRGGMTPLQIRNNRIRMASFVPGLSLVCTIDNEFIMKKASENSSDSSIVAAGTWKKDGDTYDVNLPGAKPPTTEIEIEGGARMLLPKDGDILVFDKD